MKKLLFALVIVGITCSCNNSNHEKSAVKAEEAIKAIPTRLKDGVTFKVIESTQYYTRIEISRKTDSADLFKIIDTLKINPKLVYFNVIGKSVSGQEYASVISNELLITDPIVSVQVVQDEIKRIKKFKGNDIYYKSVDGLVSELDEFDILLNRAKEWESSTNDENISKSINIYKNEISKLMQREFPNMRKSYVNISEQMLWEEDITVSSVGSTIIYVGAIFATNKNKKEFYENIQSILSRLRFKKAVFKWYKYEDQYTYYNILSKRDSEL